MRSPFTTGRWRRRNRRHLHRRAAGKCPQAVFTAQPQNQTALAGSNVTLSVTAAGLALSYQWFYNGTNLISGATNSTLSLSRAALSQSGTYSVLASNFAGAVYSQPAMLTVAPILGIVMPLELSGTPGSSWRIDYTDDLGLTDNWTVLATVTLTNTFQVYRDASALTRPYRFYRTVPLP